MSWPHRDQGFEPQIRLLPAGTWRCVVRRLPGGEFKSIEGAQPGHPTPDAALAVAVTRVADLLAARTESVAVEVTRFVAQSRLREVTIINPDDLPGPGGPPPRLVRAWEAQRDDNTWTAPQPTPQAAVLTALGRTE